MSFDIPTLPPDTSMGHVLDSSGSSSLLRNRTSRLHGRLACKRGTVLTLLADCFRSRHDAEPKRWWPRSRKCGIGATGAANRAALRLERSKRTAQPNRAALVREPYRPSTLIPALAWKCLTAPSVFGPN